jgi:2-phosphosulfolactate phosphatase
MEIILSGNQEGAIAAAKKSSFSIVIDVLRATTTIPILMTKGIQELYVARSVKTTRVFAQKLDSLILGERDCQRLPGFDFGNSPTEINASENNLPPKAIFTSSNGAKRVLDAVGSRVIILGSIVNAKAVSKWIVNEITNNSKKKISVNLIPTFTKGLITKNPLTEDQIGGIILAKEILKQIDISLEKSIRDEIKKLDSLLETHSLFELLKETEHGQKLVNLGYEKDIAFAARRNVVDCVPISRNEVISLEKEDKIHQAVKFIWGKRKRD